MITYKPSIRSKITFGYYAIVAMVVSLSVVTLVEIGFIDRKLEFGATVHDFFDTAMEIRRFEKNYFMFTDEADFREIIRNIDQAQDLLYHKDRNISSTALPEQIEQLNELFVKYKDLIERHFELVINDVNPDGSTNEARKTMFENRIRDMGERITATARKIQKSERKGIIEASNDVRNAVIISIAILSVLVIVAGQILSRIVLMPLQLIERNMDMIAGGGLDTIEINSRDQEIVSLTNAFNRMLRELEMRKRHLVRSEKLASLGTLLSGVAHELNNPLSNIYSSNQILQEEMREHPAAADAAFAGELVEQINEQCERARNIVRSLLDFSRTREFRKESLLLPDLIEETVQFLRGQVPTGVRIERSVPQNLVIFADKQRIQQALLNLIKNAVESISGEGTVSVSAGTHLAVDKAGAEASSIDYQKYLGKCAIESDTVDIEIRDTGAGIHPDVLPKVFDPFFTTKDVGKGSGLGLFIVHEVIEEHDGCIAVDSAPGKGTSFLIQLPVHLKEGSTHAGAAGVTPGE